MAYIPGMNQNWSGGTSTPANPSSVQNASQRSTKDALNPLTGMPYSGPMTESTGGQYGGYGAVGPAETSNKGANQWLTSHGMPSEGGEFGGNQGGYGPGQFSGNGGTPAGGGGAAIPSGGGYSYQPSTSGFYQPSTSGGGMNGTATSNGGWQFHPNPITAGTADQTYGLAGGGAVPGFDDGGDVPDNAQADNQAQDMPDPNGAGSSSEQDTPANANQGIPDPGNAIPAPGGDQAAPDINDMLNSAIDTYQYGLNKYGMGDQQQAMMSTKPAGPGGDQPNTNPFPTKTPAIPFGTKLSANIPMRPAGPGGDQPTPNPFPIKNPSPAFGQKTADARPIPPSPSGGRPAQGALPPAPFNPRDYLSQQDTSQVG